MRATRSQDSVGPGAADAGGERLVSQFGHAGGEGAAFACAGETCLARTRSGVIVARVEDVTFARDLCARVQLIVIADATAENPCAAGEAAVITQRQLALRGSVALSVSGDVAGRRADIAHAVKLPLRPWHDHRRFSRAARGLPPYEKSRRNAAVDPADLTQAHTQTALSAVAWDASRRALDGSAISSGGSGRPDAPAP
jgi:competence protein ComEC